MNLLIVTILMFLGILPGAREASGYKRTNRILLFISLLSIAMLTVGAMIATTELQENPPKYQQITEPVYKQIK